MLAGPRLLPRQNKRGRGIAAEARHADHARTLCVVARIAVVDEKFPRLRLAVLPVHQIAAVAEKRGGLVKIHALALAQPHVHLLQMTASVVAGDARQVDAQKHLGV
jgi:hypothetical protein